MSRPFLKIFRNGKIDSAPLLKVRKLVLFNKERFKRIRGIAGSQCRKKERSFKNLSAKNKKVLPDKPVETSYGYSAPTYTKQSQLWSWMRLSRWFEDIEDYYSAPKPNGSVKYVCKL